MSKNAQTTIEMSENENGEEFVDALTNESVVVAGVLPSFAWSNPSKLPKTIMTFNVYEDESEQHDRDDFDQETRFGSNTKKNRIAYQIKVMAINPLVDEADRTKGRTKEYLPGLLEGQTVKISGLVDIEQPRNSKLAIHDAPGWEKPDTDNPYKQHLTLWLRGDTYGPGKFSISGHKQQVRRRPTMPTL